MDKIRLRKIGNFYYVFDDDVYIINYFFNYNIRDGKCGFPKSAYNKVVNTLEEKCISFKSDCDEVDFKNKNKYKYYVKKGKYRIDIKKRKEDIYERAKLLGEDQIEELLNIIEDYIYEQ